MSQSTALATTNQTSAPVVYTGVSVIKIDRALLAKGAAARKMGGREFPGELYKHKKGRFVRGMGKKNEKLVGLDMTMVCNFPNMVETARWFDEGRPNFGPITYPAMAQDRVKRSELPMQDKTLWAVDEKDENKRMDPVSMLTILPIREKGKTEYHHFEFGSLSAAIAANKAFVDWFEKSENRDGYLPIVHFTIEEKESKKGDPYFSPLLTIVGWEKVVAEDNPSAGVSTQQTVDDDDETDGDDEEEAKTPPKSDVKVSARRRPAIGNEI